MIGVIKWDDDKRNEGFRWEISKEIGPGVDSGIQKQTIKEFSSDKKDGKWKLF
jgi:hypothetical protein